jgi:hypothetical protein
MATLASVQATAASKGFAVIGKAPDNYQIVLAQEVNADGTSKVTVHHGVHLDVIAAQLAGNVVVFPSASLLTLKQAPPSYYPA